jgi:ATP-binding cassette subfamily B protein
MIYAMIATISIGLIGQFSAFILAVSRVQASSQLLVAAIGKLYKDALFIGNLLEFLDLPESTIASGRRPFPRRLTHGIEFRDVTFIYPGTDRVALDRLTCLLPAGKCVAVVGANGAGKTTLVKLLTRLYEPTSGQILIDGAPIEEYDLADLRRNIGVIFQDFIQYEMTVQENIGFGRVEDLGDRERIRTAAEQSTAAEFLERLPQGYDTMLGRLFEGGHQLSGGQWQKVALARAFVRQAPVVILDEPTAAIDAEAEAEIFGRLREIAYNATALLIAHRFSTVRMADHIIVVDEGRLIEQGSHDELLLAEGTYARLFMLQATGYIEGVDVEAEEGRGGGVHRPRHSGGPGPAEGRGRHGRMDDDGGRAAGADRAGGRGSGYVRFEPTEYRSAGWRSPDDGHGANGYAVNGHGLNGHGLNGHGLNGHGFDRRAAPRRRPRHASGDDDGA